MTSIVRVTIPAVTGLEKGPGPTTAEKKTTLALGILMRRGHTIPGTRRKDPISLEMATAPGGVAGENGTPMMEMTGLTILEDRVAAAATTLEEARVIIPEEVKATIQEVVGAMIRGVAEVMTQEEVAATATGPALTVMKSPTIVEKVVKGIETMTPHILMTTDLIIVEKRARNVPEVVGATILVDLRGAEAMIPEEVRVTIPEGAEAMTQGEVRATV